MTAWIRNNTGAANIKQNSSGSVIPHTKEVIAPDSMIPATFFLFSGLAHLYIANAAAGILNIFRTNKPFMKVPAVSGTLSASCAKKIS